MNRQRSETADRLEALSDRMTRLNAFVGLDGFVDEIFHVVDKRESPTAFTRVPTIARFAERMANAAGKSTNIELVSQRVKLGGNGPIMANALASFPLSVSYLGNLGYPALHPVFEEFSRKAAVHSIAEPGYTDALEFEDGKVMVGKHAALSEVNWKTIQDRFGVDNLRDTLSKADLVCFVNWTMYTHTNTIWKSIQDDLAPQLHGARRLLFVDLADPEKRTVEDIQRGLDLVANFQAHFDVILGLNEKESTQIGAVLGLEPSDGSPAGLSSLAGRIRHALGLNTVVVHPVRFAVAADASGTAHATGPFTRHPLITTGAGDHFNAGVCMARCLGLNLEQSLWVGVATSGFYVRTAKSPSGGDLVKILRDWPAEEDAASH